MKKNIKKIILKLLDYFDLQLINKNQKIVELSQNDIKLIDLISKYSMTPKIRIYNLIQALRHLEHNEVQGDYVECGVWKGGNLILFKKFLEKNNLISKKIYAYDTFEGMTTPSSYDYNLSTKESAENILKGDKDRKTNNWGICSLEDVKSNILKTVGNLDSIEFVKGPVEETLNNKIPNKISLLRLDTDWYSSTKKELEVLYDNVTPGGIIIIDDYGHWGGTKKAVDEFFLNKYVWMHYVDYACRLIIKDN